MPSKLSKQDTIRILIELEQAGMIKFDTNILGEIKIIPIGFNPETWVWLYHEKWGIDQHDSSIMNIITEALNIKKLEHKLYD